MNYWLLIIAMGAVTYIPRMIPMVFLRDIEPSPFVKRFLNYIPYAALTTLIFPGILYSTNNLFSALTGGIVSIITAFYKENLLLIVFAGIASAFVIEIVLF
ncbi:AzlD domain-containing protein [Iocasia frigidifontis]|uniref:AzlD domain-containing protein n=1 Tax=Iocasia fonsfrigidae TaxID=2682810 RepID=A0A8A7KCB8_9FIRM|nr:AzlD domain-containing protein [Iocasia fonsfrigidae]QTL97725.1 AzlD domain-containing protein [Iocasia fonsfrigidae]